MELLSVRHISKYFRDTLTLADDRVSLEVSEGEIRAVVGENGAGKSTLARIIAGLVAQDSGEVLVRGARVRPGSVRDAERAGIGFVPQVSLLAGDLTVAENMALSREPRTMGVFLSRRKAYVQTALLVERFGFRLDPDARVSSLSAAERRQADIARALVWGGRLIVLDEPSSILSESESAGLFALLARLAKEGKAILLITHRLSEVMKAADSITVLRDGAVVADLKTAQTDEERVSSLMARRGTRSLASLVGEPRVPEPRAPGSGASALALVNVRLARDARSSTIRVAGGEVLAVTALAGNGLDRLEDYASGMLAPFPGQVLVGGRDLAGIPREALRSGLLGYVPSRRERRGLCLQATMRDNILALRGKEFGALDWLDRRGRDASARAAALPLGLAADPRQLTASLSGGNRQRLLLARELDRPRPVLVLAEPLQSLDLASQAEAAATVRGLAAKGSAILVLVSNVEEALGLADRVIALYRGEVAWEGPNEGEATRPLLLSAMTGVAFQGLGSA